MKNRLPSYPESLHLLTLAVIATATNFGLVAASAHMEASAYYYVAYRTPSGYLVRTEPYGTPDAALLAFKQEILAHILRSN